MDTTVISILNVLKMRGREVMHSAQGHRAMWGSLDSNPSILAPYSEDESACLGVLVYLCEL